MTTILTAITLYIILKHVYTLATHAPPNHYNYTDLEGRTGLNVRC